AARALVVALAQYEQTGDPVCIRLINTYLSFIQHQQLPDGRFHNFMSYSRQPEDECGGEDTMGRALWGLGEAVAHGPTRASQALAGEIFEKALGALQLRHPRAIAYAVCGLSSFLEKYGGAALARRRLIELASVLAEWFKPNSEGWRWFGDELTYGNAKMPHAMLLAFKATGDERFKRIGLETLDFLLSVTYRRGYFDFIGNQGWYRSGGERSVLSQQPIEAGYTADACLAAYQITGTPHYFDMARAAAEWLLGRNRLGVRLYDTSTGACADGLDPHGASLNQGAESVICGLLALLTVSIQIEKDAQEPTLSEPMKAAAMESAR
ncbi:MAG: glycosyl transferase family 1, partial [Blastocatellia bacterium]